MSLFDDASLAMIPSAYKDGKLYSIKPTDGSGDFTFSRGSNLAATRVDVNGLIEKGRENLLLQSNNFDTTWVQYQGGSVTSGQAGYDGTNNAWKLNVVSSQSFSGLYQDISGSYVGTQSIYAKAGTLDHLGIVNMGGANFAAWFDLTNGTIGTQGSSNVDASIESVGNGWYRLSVTQSGAKSYFQIKPSDGENTPSGSDGYIYIQDAQLEQGLVATDYIETTTTTAQAGILEDMPRLDYSGGASCPSLKLEPQRSNLIEYSEYYGGWGISNASVASNQSISPEGLLNASNITDAGGAYGNAFSNSITFSSADYSLSLFIKKKTSTTNYLGIEIAGNGSYLTFNSFTGDIKYINSDVFNNKKLISFNDDWWHLSFTVNVSASTAVGIRFFPSISTNGSSLSAGATGTETIYGAQLEQGSYPTSYIPTYGTSQTRSADYVQQNTLRPNNLSGSAFTYFLDMNTNTSVAVFSGYFNEVDSGGNYKAGFVWSNGLQWRTPIGGGNYYVTLDSVVAKGDRAKMLVVVDGTERRVYYNGSLIITIPNCDNNGADTDGIVPYYGSANVNFYSGLYNQILVFDTALTDSECIALTTL